MKSIENLDNISRILVWDCRRTGWIKYKRVGFFKKKTIIYFTSVIGGFYDRKFKSEGELDEYMTKNNLFLEKDEVYEKWSIDLIYSYQCSKTIYFNSKTAQNDWLKEHCNNNHICVENGRLV